MSWNPSILNIVAKSPLNGIEKHMGVVTDCVHYLPLFIQATKENDWQKAERALETVVQLENQADALKVQLKLNLHKGLFLAVARADILKIITTQDMIANITRDICGLMFGRKMVIPESLYNSFYQFIIISTNACNLANDTIHQLHAVSESGFGENVIDLVENMITQLDQKETECDVIQIDVRRQLFDLEATLPAVSVMFLYAVIDKVAHLADCAQNIGEQLLLMVTH